MPAGGGLQKFFHNLSKKCLVVIAAGRAWTYLHVGKGFLGVQLHSVVGKVYWPIVPE